MSYAECKTVVTDNFEDKNNVHRSAENVARLTTGREEVQTSLRLGVSYHRLAGLK